MTSPRKKILVLSPHLDDAVLSCGDHILEWKRQGHEVTVVSIFTKFQDRFISESAKESLVKGGYKNAKECEGERKKEDVKAMKQLGVNYSHFGFIDGWFRIHNDKPVYENSQLFSGEISSNDKSLMMSIKNKVSKYNKFQKVITPFGVGKHADHLIIRNIAQQIFTKDQIVYYLDQPYYLNKNNWNIQLCWTLLTHNKSTIKISSFKKALLINYFSQVSQFFNDDISYSEVLLSAKF